MTKQIINKIMIIKTLMVGDLVSDGCNAVKVKAIMGDMINAFNGTELCGYFPDAVRPIPLNAEILEKLGFNYEGECVYEMYIDDFRITILLEYVEKFSEVMIVGNLDCRRICSFQIFIKNLHELQNYVRLATGHELYIDNLIGKQL